MAGNDPIPDAGAADYCNLADTVADLGMAGRRSAVCLAWFDVVRRLCRAQISVCRPVGTRPIRRLCRFASAQRSRVAARVETALRLRNGAPRPLHRNLVAIVADNAVRSACAP